jgi:hypothetical protein
MKKILFILLCFPMIGFGQSDKIIFSIGDTIIGNVVEVGVNDITYQHKGEITNNIIKKRELAKVIYSSGRTENYAGLNRLESKIKKENHNKIRNQKLEERKSLGIQNNWAFKIGTTSLIPFLTKSNASDGLFVHPEDYVDKTSILGINIEILYNHKVNSKIGIINSLNYYYLGYVEESYRIPMQVDISGQDLGFSDYGSLLKQRYSYEFLSVSLMGSYSINDRFSVMSGISFDKGLYYTYEVLEHSNDDPNNSTNYLLGSYSKPLTRSFISLVVSIKYSIFKQFFICSDAKWTFNRINYTDKYIGIGIGIDLKDFKTID